MLGEGRTLNMEMHRAVQRLPKQLQETFRSRDVPGSLVFLPLSVVSSCPGIGGQLNLTISNPGEPFSQEIGGLLDSHSVMHVFLHPWYAKHHRSNVQARLSQPRCPSPRWVC